MGCVCAKRAKPIYAFLRGNINMISSVVNSQTKKLSPKMQKYNFGHDQDI